MKINRTYKPPGHTVPFRARVSASQQAEDKPQGMGFYEILAECKSVLEDKEKAAEADTLEAAKKLNS